MSPILYARDREKPRSELGQEGNIEAQGGKKTKRTAHACVVDKAVNGLHR